MRTRDRHVALVLGAMLFFNVATALVAVASCYVYRKRFRALSEDMVVTIKTSEKSALDAASMALALVDAIKEGGVVSDASIIDARPVVLGYGQTRSKGAHYIYRDVRDPDGIVRREMVQRIPFKAR